MKKFIVFLLVFSLVGCFDSKPDETNTDEEKNVYQTQLNDWSEENKLDDYELKSTLTPDEEKEIIEKIKSNIEWLEKLKELISDENFPIDLDDLEKEVDELISKWKEILPEDDEQSPKERLIYHLNNLEDADMDKISFPKNESNKDQYPYEEMNDNIEEVVVKKISEDCIYNGDRTYIILYKDSYSTKEYNGNLYISVFIYNHFSSGEYELSFLGNNYYGYTEDKWQCLNLFGK